VRPEEISAPDVVGEEPPFSISSLSAYALRPKCLAQRALSSRSLQLVENQGFAPASHPRANRKADAL
jgi:hypothetical protein